MAMSLEAELPSGIALALGVSIVVVVVFVVVGAGVVSTVGGGGGGAATGVWPSGLGVGWMTGWWAPKGTGTGIGVVETRRLSSDMFALCDTSELVERCLRVLFCWSRS